jgi:hypothetical protein
LAGINNEGIDIIVTIPKSINWKDYEKEADNQTVKK